MPFFTSLVTKSAKAESAGARAATVCLTIPPNKDCILNSASFASSTPLAALDDITTPRARASPSNSVKPVRPSANVFTKAAPSESNSLNAILSGFTPLFLASSNASARVSICSSNGSCNSFLASTPSSRNAPLASPVPTAASAVRRVKR